MTKLRRIFTISVMLITVLSMSVVVAPNASADASAGDLIKMDGLSSVYYLGADDKRYVFPNENTYFSWYADFSSVVTIPQSELESYPLGGNVTVRPGTELVKITTNPNVYAVETGGKLVLIPNEETAIALYGSNWAKRVRDVSDAFFTNYEITTTELDSDTYPEGTLVKMAAAADVYYIDADGKARKIANEASFLANRFQWKHIVTAGSGYTLPEAGTEIAGAESALVDVSESGSSTGIEPGAGTGLTAALASDTPASTVLAASTLYNNMLNFNVTASNDGDVKVEGITITKIGLTSNTNISGISIWSEGKRHGNIISSLTSAGQATIGFASNPIVVSSGTTKKVSVKVNLGSGATGGTLGLRIANAANIQTNGASVSGSFPVSGNTMSLTSATTATYTIAGQAVGGAAADGTANVNINDTKEVFKFQVTETSGTENLALDSITLYMEGTARDEDLSSLKLYSILDLNNPIATALEFDGRYATFNLSEGYEIPQGNSRVFTLKATPIDGSGRWFRMQVQNDYDVMARGATNNFYLAPSSFTAAVTSDNGYFQMRSGSLTINKATEAPSGEVSVGASNQTLAVFDLKAVGEDLEIRKMYIDIIRPAGGHLLAGTLRIMDYDGKNTYLSTTASSSALYTAASHGAGSDQSLSQYLTIKSGETKKIKVVADIYSNATSSDNWTVGVKSFYVKRLSSLDYTTLNSTNFTDGNQLTATTANITVSKNTSVPNSSVIPGSNNVKIGSYSLKASSAGNVTVSQIQIGFNTAGTATPSDDLSNLKIKVGSTEYAYSGTISQTANSISTTGLVVTTAGITVDVYANVLNNASLVSGLTFITQIPASGITGVKGSESVTAPAGAVVGQAMQVGTASLTIEKVTSSATKSRILLAGVQGEEIYRLKLTAGADRLVIEQLALTVSSTNGDARNYAGNTVYLKVGSQEIAGMFNGANVLFQIPSGLTIEPYLFAHVDLKVNVNNSSGLGSGSADTFHVMGTGANEDVTTSGTRVKKSNSTYMGASEITTTSLAISNYFLFHDAAPSVAAPSQAASTIGTTAEVGKFTITNGGQVDLKLKNIIVKTAVSGLKTGGSVSNFRIYDDASTLLATSNDIALTSTTTSADYNLDVSATGVSVAAGQTRTFYVKANTTNVLTGFSQAGTVTLTLTLDGSTGYLAAGGTGQDSYWNNSNIRYGYRPIGASSDLPASGYYNAAENVSLDFNQAKWTY